MKVIRVTDLPDGGAEVECEFTNKEVQLLVEHAVTSILKEYLAKEEKKTPKKRDKFDRNSLKE